MKILISLFYIVFFAIAGVSSQPISILQRDFVKPPANYKPHVLWQWMGGMISRDGINQDLHAMSEQGIGGVMIMQLPDQCPYPYQWSFKNNKHHIKALSDEWFDMVHYAIQEADKLGLEVGIFICTGWSQAGGPMVSSQKSLKLLNHSDIIIDATTEKITQIKLPHVANKENYSHGNYFPKWFGEHQFNKSDFYRDVCVLAYPHRENQIYKNNEIINLTDKVDVNGVLTYQFPTGKWHVKRIALVPENGYNQPAPIESIGLECDRMDTTAVNLVFDAVVKRIATRAQKEGLKAFKSFETDSYEGGYQDFGIDFSVQFFKRRGYDCVPMLPAWLDRRVIIESRNLSDRFISDMKKTISELWQERYYTHLQRLAVRHNLNWYLQPYWGAELDWRSIAGVCSNPGHEFWTHKNSFRGAASETSALYGLKTIWAEAFTSESWESAWRLTPNDLKPHADNAFSNGVNKLYMHGFVLNPFDNNLQPGVTMSYWGTQLSRHLTWWKYSGEWHNYLARCQYMLHLGSPQFDYLSYPSVVESEPQLIENQFGIASLTDDILFNKLNVRSNKLYTDKSSCFKAIILKENSAITTEALLRIYQLVQAGATLIANRPPSYSSSLKDYPKSDSMLFVLINKIWGEKVVLSPRKIRLGKGIVFANYKQEEAISLISGTPLFTCAATDHEKNDLQIKHYHRKTKTLDLFFVTNQENKKRTVRIKVKSKFHQPSWWNPVTGTTEFLSNYTLSSNELSFEKTLAEYESGFIILSNLKGNHQKMEAPVKQQKMEVKGPWKMTFSSKINGVNKEITDTLFDWIQHSDPSIKYFSGTAIYKKTIFLPNISESMSLHFTHVNNLARIKINDKIVGILWCAPWSIQIPQDVLKNGENNLEIEVCNTWVNRLIGDEQEPETLEYVDVTGHTDRKGGYDEKTPGYGLKELPSWVYNIQDKPIQNRKTFSTWKFYTKQSPLQKAGISGKIYIRF